MAVLPNIAECIQLGEDAIRHRNHSDRVPFGLRNAAAMYSDQIRVRLSDPATLGQIRSDSVSEAELGFQDANRRIPMNRRSPIWPCNLDADFVLDYNGQDVFATPSANLAAVF